MVNPIAFRSSLDNDGEICENSNLDHTYLLYHVLQVVDFTKRTLYYSDSMSCNSSEHIIPRIRLVPAYASNYLVTGLQKYESREFIEKRYQHEVGQSMEWTGWTTKLCQVRS